MSAQNAENPKERKLFLLGQIGVAQSFLGVDTVLSIKRKMFGSTKKLNDLENYEITHLLSKCRVEYSKTKKREKNGKQ